MPFLACTIPPSLTLALKHRFMVRKASKGQISQRLVSQERDRDGAGDLRILVFTGGG